MSEWQPIETAPKDGTILLLWDGEGAVVGAWFDAKRNSHDAEWLMVSVFQSVSPVTGVEGDTFPVDPTHWMPLPEPPPT